MMNFTITTFTNPFSFFCIAEETKKETKCLGATTNSSSRAEAVHGQYVAVMWNGNWVRGIVSMEAQFLIWLIDYGVYMRPTEKTVFMDLSPQQKKIPSKIFEASIHGAMPISKIITEEMTMENEISNIWNLGAINKAKELIGAATKTYFIPVALLITKCNEIVLGDLYLNIPEKGIVNIVDELEIWPTFLSKNEEAYLKNLSSCYVTRRRHRACILKPNIRDIPEVTLETTIEKYREICAKAPKLELDDVVDDDSNGSGSTVIERNGNCVKKNTYVLTPEEIEEYATKFVEICGREYNVLDVLRNKTRDLNICERYKDYDSKLVGRGCRRSGALPADIRED